jgi:hypothetical protein
MRVLRASAIFWFLTLSVCAAQVSRSPDVSLTLVADRQTYNPDDPIRISLALRNRGTVPVSVPFRFASDLIALTITDQDGKIVAPSRARIANGYGLHQNSIQAGETSTVTDVVNGVSQTVFPISSWGYHIDVPGRYTIVASLAVPVTRQTGDSAVADAGSRQGCTYAEVGASSPIFITVR